MYVCSTTAEETCRRLALCVLTYAAGKVGDHTVSVLAVSVLAAFLLPQSEEIGQLCVLQL